MNTEGLEMMYGKPVAQYLLYRLGSEWREAFVTDIVSFEKNCKFCFALNTFPAFLPLIKNCCR